MSALGILAIVAGVLLAAVFAVGVATAMKTRAMRDRDLVLAEALAGTKTQPPLTPRTLRLRRLSQEAAFRRRMLEQVTFRWEQLDPEAQNSLARSAARRRGEDPEELSSYINDLIQTGRRPHAAVLLLSVENELPELPSVESELPSVEPAPFELPLAGMVTWYRDRLLSLHPAYLAIRASLLERVTQLLTLTVRAEQDGEIPQRRRYSLNRRNRG